MAEAVVSIVVEQLADLLLKQANEEIDLLSGVEDKVRHLSKTFERIQAVLLDAERKWITEESVKIWLQELEHVSYEIDDVLDQWNYQILRKQIEGSSSTSNINASTSISKQRVCSFTPSSCFCFKQLVVNREIAVKIKELNSKLDFIAKEKEKFRFDKTSGHDSQVWKPVPSTSLIDECDIFGRETDKENLVSQLLSDENRRQEGKHDAIQIVSITGTGGIGKTALAQLAYNDDQVKRHYEKRGWVCVSNPFDEIRIARAILEALHPSSSPNLKEFNSLLEQVRDSISGKKFLLVLDDVWTEDQIKWQPFNVSLKHGAPGSTILLTTRSGEVARVAGATCTIPLGVLSESDSWSLFSKVAFSGRTEVERARFETIGKEINSKCKNLPLAIKTVGGLLCSKNTLEAWQQVKDSNMWELEVAEVQLFPHLYLSYVDLLSPLKRCFSYCAVFPKDSRIDVDELVKAWLGQGYLNSTKSENEMELKGREYFEYLSIRSFFQDFEKDSIFGERIVACKMHDIVHDFAQFLTKTECLIIGGEKKEAFSNNARHLTWFGSEEAISSEEAIDMGQLRSFFAKNFKLDTRSTINLLNGLKLVRVLKLNGCHFKELPKTIRKLIHLRYLGLCDNDELTKLPTTVYDLYNLQTLNLDGCWRLIELPPGIEKLKKLRHLFLSKTNMNYPEGIGKLTCLQTLKSFVVKGEHNKLGYLKSLNQLRGSLDIEIAENLDVANAKDADIKSKKHIQDLTLRFSRSFRVTEDVMEALEPPPNIQILCVIKYEGTRLATWVTSLKYLRHLTLKSFYNLTSLPSLGILPLLEKLAIWSFRNLKSVGPTFLGIKESLLSRPVGFPMLEELELIRCDEWEEWEDITLEEEEDDTVSLMPHLRWLTIGKCLKLKTLPCRLLRKAPSLEYIQLDGKRYNPSTILSITLTLAEVKARKPDHQSTSTKEALQLERLQKMIADIRSNDSNLQLLGTIQFNEFPYKNWVPNDEIIQSGVIFRFVEFLTREDFPQLQFQAVSALAEMASGTSDYVRVTIDHGALPNFIKLISSPRDDIRDLALLALGNIANSSRECRDLVLEHGALMPLLQLNEHAHNAMLLRRGAWVLSKFCYPNESQFEQIKLSLPTLRRLIYSNDEDVLRRACQAFSRLSNGTHDNIQVVIEAGICQRLVELLIHPSPVVFIPTLETVRNITTGNYVHTQCIIDNGALPRLLSLLSHNHEESNSNITTEIQVWVVAALKNIASGTSENIRVLIDHGVVPIFVKLLGSPSEDVQNQVVMALGYIATGDDVQTQVIIDHGALPCLLSLLTHDHGKSIKINACWTISNITAGNRDQTQAIIEAGLIAPLLNLLKTAKFDIKKQAARAISNVTFNVTNEQMKFLVNEGCIKPLCDLLVCSDPEIVTLCLNGLENILEVGKVEKNQRNTGDVNNFAQMIDEAEGLEKIKNLNDEIHERVVQILETYWLDKEKNDDNDDEEEEEEEKRRVKH